jgi:enamine deaminase RidA (YjgF/YER057c/UK114 family)
MVKRLRQMRIISADTSERRRVIYVDRVIEQLISSNPASSSIATNGMLSSVVEDKIKSMGLTLPIASLAPKGNYIPYNITGKYVYLSGHLPQPAEGDLVKGRLGENMSVEEGAHAARLCGLQMVASMKAATGGELSKIKKIVKVVGFVASTNDFTKQPSVLNGCSDFLCDIFGVDIGRHVRSAIGVNVLPLGVPVEIEAIVELY